MKIESTKESTMPLRKTAIAIPEEVLKAIDAAARERGESRNRFINRVLATALGARRDAAITRRLDRLFADETIVEQQLEDARSLDELGTDRASERW